MFISKIPVNSKVELQCSIAGKDSVTFNTEAVLGQLSKDKQHLLYCLPIMIEGKLVRLSDCQIKACVLNKGDHRRYLFNIDKATHVTNSRTDGYLTVLSSSEDAKPLNYRRAVRLPCDVPAVLSIEGRVSDIQCRTYDISTCGFAVLIPKDENPIAGLPVTVSFYVEEFGWKFTLDAVIARVQEVSSEVVLVGCDLTDYYPNLVALCNHLKANSRVKPRK